MKKLNFLVYILFVFLGVISCDKVTGLSGDPLAENYIEPKPAVRQLAKITAGNANVMSLTYDNIMLKKSTYQNGYSSQVFDNGQRIYRIDHAYKNTTDSIYISQYLTYDATGKVSEIGENKKIMSLTPNTPVIKEKTHYTINYSYFGKPDKIMATSGVEVPQVEFVFTKYKEILLSYTSGNVTGLKITNGDLNAQGQPVPPTAASAVTQIKYEGYDIMNSPYALLPMAYRLHYFLSVQPYDAHVFSDSNPKRIILLNDTTGNVTLGETVYSYDGGQYPTFGFGKQFYYRFL